MQVWRHVYSRHALSRGSADVYTSMADSSKSNWPIQLTHKSIVEKDLNSGDICNKYTQSTRHEYL